MDDKQAIVRMIRDTFDGFAEGNAKAMQKMDHPDSTIWDVFQPDLVVGQDGRADFRKHDIEQSKKRGKLTLNVDEPVVDVWENTALARYYLRFSYTPPNPTSGHVRITAVFRRVDGRWLRMHHHEGIVPTGVPPITEAPPK